MVLFNSIIRKLYHYITHNYESPYREDEFYSNYETKLWNKMFVF